MWRDLGREFDEQMGCLIKFTLVGLVVVVVGVFALGYFLGG